MGVTSGQTHLKPRRLGLQLGAALLFVAVAGLTMSELGPPRPLVALFDADWVADQPFDEAEVLEVRVPNTVGPERLLALETGLSVASSRVAHLIVREDPDTTRFWLTLESGTPPDRLEAIVGSGAGSLVFLPVLDEGLTANAIRAFVESRPELGLGTDQVDPMSAKTEESLIAGLEALRDSCASCRPRLGEALVIERDAKRWSAKVVTHREPVFDQRYLAGADVEMSQFDGKPRVALYLSEDGRQAFRALSRELVGGRLAFVMDGQVLSSPRIMVEIDSDRLEVSVNEASPADMLAEATRIASALTPRVGLPSEATWQWFTLPAAADSAMALSFGLALFLSALLGWFGALGVQRYERWAGIEGAAPQVRTPATSWPSLSLIAIRTGATAVALMMPTLVAKVPIPVLDQDLLASLGGGTRAFSSIGAGGTTQLILGFLLAATIVRVVPALSSLRRGDFDARRRLLLPTGLIVFALCALQAVALTPLYTGAELLEPGLLSVILLALSLAAGTFLLWGAASLATLAGFGHGFSLIIIGSIAHSVFEVPAKLADGRLLAVVLLVGVVALYASSRRLRTAEMQRRLPLAGLAPIEFLGIIQAILLVVSLLSNLDLRTPQLGPWLGLVVFVGLTTGFAWLIARPIPRRDFVAGLLPSLLVVVLFVQGAVFLAGLGAEAVPMKLTELLALICVAPVLFDVGEEVRATLRHGRLSRVASTHDPDEADRLAALLVARDIPATPRALRHRALLRFLAPYLPIEVLVPLGDRRAALAFLREDELGELAAPFGDRPATETADSGYLDDQDS